MTSRQLELMQEILAVQREHAKKQKEVRYNFESILQKVLADTDEIVRVRVESLWAQVLQEEEK